MNNFQVQYLEQVAEHFDRFELQLFKEKKKILNNCDVYQWANTTYN